MPGVGVGVEMVVFRVVACNKVGVLGVLQECAKSLGLSRLFIVMVGEG